MGFGRLSDFVACFIFVSFLVGFVSQRHFPRELPMRLKHLYYQTDSNRVSEWNCDTCDTLCRLQRSNITDAPRSVCASHNPRFPDRFRTSKRKSVSSCLTAFHAA